MYGKPSAKGFLGKTHTDEAREKIRQANIGKKVSEETRQKIGDRYYPTGENHPNYGRKFTYSDEWYEAIRNRPKQKCIWCNIEIDFFKF